MTLEKQSEFARRVGVDRAQITRWKSAGRLVMDQNGLVEVEASLARVEATRGSRHDVSDRHARERGQALQLDLPAGDQSDADQSIDSDQSALELDAIGLRTRRAQMLKEEHAAALKRLELEERERLLIQRSAVLKAAADACAVLLSAGDGLADRLATQLVGADAARVRALLDDEMTAFFELSSSQLATLAGDQP